MKGQFIYKIINTINNKFYVGSTANTVERFRTHRNRLRRGKHHTKHLQAAWDKYGEAAFVFHVIEEVPIDKSLQEAEEVWLSNHVGKSYCYNTSLHAAAPWRGVYGPAHPHFGRPVSEQQKQDISKRLKEFYAEDITNHPRFGKTHSDETKAKISASKLANPTRHWLGKERNGETKQKIGDAQRGVKKAPRTLSEEGRAKIRAAAEAGHYNNWEGRKHTAESKAKMSKTVFVMPDGILFPSLTVTLQYYGLKMPTLTRALKSGKPLSKGRLMGYSFSYGGIGATQTQTDKDLIANKLLAP
jgi:group I intron endonuclease